MAHNIMYGVWYIVLMEKTTLYLTAEIQRGLKEIAKRNGRPQAELIREALSEYLEKSGRPSLRSVGAGQDSELAARKTEDWLDHEWSGR
ncbi:hypothetical protein BH23ACT11_BH23ACT11_26070 [soil metagenome]